LLPAAKKSGARAGFFLPAIRARLPVSGQSADFINTWTERIDYARKACSQEQVLMPRKCKQTWRFNLTLLI